MKNRMFGGDEPATARNPSPRTTIVGGRPPEEGAELPPVPIGLERLLRMAAVDEPFQAALLERRAGLAGSAGVELVASERAILEAATADQLRAMIASLPPPPTSRRAFLKQAALAALTVGAAPALSGCEWARSHFGASENALGGGHEADIPPERPVHNEMEAEGGIAPTPVPDAGVERPDRPQPTRGIRSDAPPPKPEEGK